MRSPEFFVECRQMIAEAASVLKPEGVIQQLDEASRQFFELHLESLQADGGTLWIVVADEEALEAVFNPWEPKLIGQRQPLSSGLISLCFFLEHGIMENEVKSHQQHDPSIDRSTGKQTAALLAAPVHVADTLCGVWSAVRFAHSEQVLFPQEALMKHELAAVTLGRLIEISMVRRLISPGA